MTWQIAAPLAIILLFGLPHGAADAILALRLRTLGKLSLGGFMAAYLLLTGIALIFWWWLPMLSLIAFLFMSVVHFGLGDTAKVTPDHMPAPRANRGLRAIVHGATVITIVPLAHGPEVSEIFSLLADRDARTLTDVLGWLTWLWLFGVVWIAISGKSTAVKAVLEIMLIAVLLAILPPLWGFAFYFCAIHAARHSRAVISALTLDGSVNWLWVAGVTGISIAAIAGAAAALQTTSFDAALIRATFIGLAALTIPHMILIDVYGALPRINAARGALSVP